MLERAEQAIKDFLKSFNYFQTLEVFTEECDSKIKEEGLAPHLKTKVLGSNH